MSVAYFDGDDICTESYLTFSGSSQPSVIIYPRTIGGILQESGIVDKRATLHAYVIPPSSKREDIENFFNLLNERIGSKEASLVVNGNIYPKFNVANIEYDPVITNKYTKFLVNFEMNDQNTDSDIRQLVVPDLVGFSRGRKATFASTMEDSTIKTFTFWHNMDLVRNFDTEITIRISKNQFGSTGRVIRVGGFERIVCYCWIIGPDKDTRKNLEGYFYNIINGPLGRLGTLNIDGRNPIEKCVFTDFSMDEDPLNALHYQLTFTASLQC